MSALPFTLPPFRDRTDCPRAHLEWGPRGARRAAARGDIVVIVDVLRFSTTTVTAVERGAIVYPGATGREDDSETAAEPARRDEAEIAGRTAEVFVQTARLAEPSEEIPAPNRPSLSPRSCLDLEPGTRLILDSRNGAACCRLGRAAPLLLVACLRNARATARFVARQLEASSLSLTVVACGERWTDALADKAGDETEGDLRFAVEDYLGAGAILSELSCPLASDAHVCARAFQACLTSQTNEFSLAALLHDSASGLEPRERELGEDVAFAAELNRSEIVVIQQGEGLIRAEMKV